MGLGYRDAQEIRKEGSLRKIEKEKGMRVVIIIIVVVVVVVRVIAL